MCGPYGLVAFRTYFISSVVTLRLRDFAGWSSASEFGRPHQPTMATLVTITWHVASEPWLNEERLVWIKMQLTGVYWQQRPLDVSVGHLRSGLQAGRGDFGATALAEVQKFTDHATFDSREG